jgi:hypothetical protein
VTAAQASCRRHRPVLVDFVDHGERTAATPAALDHLAICRACERELTEVALTVAALRRAGTAWRNLPVPEPGPEEVRATAAGIAALASPRRRSPWAWRLHVGALVTSAGLAALLVAPRLAAQPPRTLIDRAPALPAAVVTWQQAEHRLAASPDTAPVAALGTLPPRYPDGRLRPWKEVPSGDATARELEPS